MSMYESFKEAFRMKVMQALPQDVENLACDPFIFGTFLIALLALIVSLIKRK